MASRAPRALPAALRRRPFASAAAPRAPPPPYDTASPAFNFLQPTFIRRRGLGVVHDPWSNKGTGFPLAERDRLRIRGLVPPRTLSLEVQVEKMKVAIEGKRTALEKHSFLSELQDRNETLYFRLLIDNLETLAPIVYTPTVGLACQKFGSVFRRARGMYFSSQDKGLLATMCFNWPHDDVEVIVVTDGSRILGLGASAEARRGAHSTAPARRRALTPPSPSAPGDLGSNGMGIPIGKLALYVAAGGIDPRKVLPVMLDLGTDNKELQQDPWYLGMTHPRLRGEAYFSAVHEFVHAVRHRWPAALVQFEDFSSDVASPILETYRHSQLCFNDDIQGTGSVTLGAVLAAVRTQGAGAKLSDQRIVICGAGSAGIGVASSLAAAMSDREGIPASATASRFYVLDKDGLLGAARAAPGGALTAAQRAFCRPAGDLPDGAPLAAVVAAVRPTILLGFTGQGQTWTEPVIREMARHCARPIIFPLSNPTQNAECNAEQAYKWTEGRAVFGGGSPFDPVALPDGSSIQPSQINNMFVFPGIGLASLAVRPKRITNSMFQAAAYAVAGMVSEEDLAKGRVVPRVRDIRSVSAAVAAAAAQTALAEGIVQKIPPAGDLRKYMASLQYDPIYTPLYNDVYQ